MSATRIATFSLISLFALRFCALAQGPATPPPASTQPADQVNPWVAAAPAPGPELCQCESAECTSLSQISSVALHPFASEHFVVLHAAQDTWGRRVAGLLEKANTEFYASIRKAGYDAQPLPNRLIWVCFRGMDDFEQYSRQNDQIDMSWTDGYYSARTNRVALMLPAGAAVRQGDGVEVAAAARVAQFGPQPDTRPAGEDRLDQRWITHELAHQLSFNYGLQKRGVMYPLWLSEGLATNFEADNQGRFGFGRDNTPRRRSLLSAYTHGRLTPLRRFVAMDRLESSGEAQARQDYAECWGLYRFLSQQRPDQLRQYLLTLKALDSGNREGAVLRREFVEAFGPIEQMQSDWEDWLDGLVVAAAKNAKP